MKYRLLKLFVGFGGQRQKSRDYLIEHASIFSIIKGEKNNLAKANLEIVKELWGLL